MRQAAEPAADANLLLGAGDQLVALDDGFPRINLLGGMAVIAVDRKERLQGRLDLRIARPGPRHVVQLPQFAGIVADIGLASPAAEDRPRRDDRAGRKRREPLLDDAQRRGEGRIDRIGPIVAGQRFAVALLGAVSAGKEDLALAAIDPEDAHASMPAGEHRLAVDRDDVELQSRVVVLEELAKRIELAGVIQMAKLYLAHPSALPAECQIFM